jgi:hypothetical protein
MCLCSCRISVDFTSFISIAVLRLGLNGSVDSEFLMLFSIIHGTARKLKRRRNLRGPFILSLDCDGSEVVNCNSVVVDRYIVPFDMTDRCCFWKMVLCWFVFWDASLGVSSYAVSTLSTDGLFLAWGFLQGMRADKSLDSLSSRSAWFGRSLWPGRPSNST